MIPRSQLAATLAWPDGRHPTEGVIRDIGDALKLKPVRQLIAYTPAQAALIRAEFERRGRETAYWRRRKS